MRHVLQLLIVFPLVVLPLQASAQDDTGAPSREDLLKAAIGRDRGNITAMESFGVAGKGVVIGHSTGAVLHCYGEETCEEMGGTPNIPVQHLAVSQDGASAVIWVSYARGALYQCIRSVCKRFLWHSPLGN